MSGIYYFVGTNSFIIQTNIAQHILVRIIILRYNLTTLVFSFSWGLDFDNYLTYPGADAGPFVRFIQQLQSTSTNTSDQPRPFREKRRSSYVGLVTTRLTNSHITSRSLVAETPCRRPKKPK